MIGRLIERVEGARISFIEGIFAFAGVVFIRFFLEGFSSPTPSFPAAPDVPTMVHYLLFFLGMFLSIALLMRVFAPDIKKITKFLLFGFPIIWLSPIFDIITSGGAGARMSYIFTNAGSFWRVFLSAGSAGPFGGLTPGLHTELIAILAGIFFYTLIKTKRMTRALGALACSYILAFIWMIFPSFIAILHEIFAGSVGASVVSYITASFWGSHAVQEFVRPTVQFSYPYAADTVFNIGISYVYYILDFALIVAWLACYRLDALRTIAKNSRIDRLGHYFTMIIVGVFAAAYANGGKIFSNWLDGFALAALFVSFYSACAFAIGVNDIYDVDIDKVSNKDRPLVTAAFSSEDMKGANAFFLGWSLLGGYIGGYWTFFLVAVFTAAYYIYSAPPLRLKRIPILSPFLIAIASLSATMAGFYFASAGRSIYDIPVQLVLLILVCFTLGVNMKDIKDIEGDRAGGIPTIPVIFGERAGKQIVGALLAVGFLAAPVILRSWSIFIPSVIAAALGYYFVVVKPYREWKIFALYFLYAACVGIIFWA